MSSESPVARMNQIKEINPEDGVAIVEPGVITGELQERVKELGYFYPPDPASPTDPGSPSDPPTDPGIFRAWS